MQEKIKSIGIGSFSAIVEKVVKEVALEHSLTVRDTSKIVMSQFLQVKTLFATSRLQNGLDTIPIIRLIYLGAWKPSLSKFKKLLKAVKDKEDE